MSLGLSPRSVASVPQHELLEALRTTGLYLRTPPFVVHVRSAIPIVAEALANGLEFLQGHSRSHNDRRGADGSEELAIGYCAPKQ